MGAHDGMIIKVALGGSNLGKVKNVSWKWSRLGTILAKPHVLPVTMKELLDLTPDQQNVHKAANGYFIAAHCLKNKRARANIKFRSLVAFDCDTVPAWFPDHLEQRLTNVHDLEFRWHTTAKSSSDQPRVRIYFLLDSDVPAEDYGAVTRILTQKLDPQMAMVDPVSFRVAQMMYMPVVTNGGEYRHGHSEGKLLDWKALLNDFQTADDLSTLPQHHNEKKLRFVSAKMEDPRTKSGSVGAFCRVYDIFSVIDAYLPDVYSASEGQSGKRRYTYNAGSGANGAEVQEDGLFLYSHHSTDPAGEQNCNAYDLVRNHYFPDLVLAEHDKTPMGERLSVIKMNALVDADPLVQESLVEFDDSDVGDILDDEPEQDGPQISIEQKIIRQSAERLKTFDDDIEDLLGAPTRKHNLPPERPKLSKPKNVIEEFNRKHAVVKNGGSTVILNKPDPTSPKSDLSYSRASDFGLFYANRKVPVGNKDVPATQFWLEHPERETYRDVVFAPGQQTPLGILNLWQGYAYRPDADASCEPFLWHLEHVICSSNAEHYAYLLGWLAHLVQRPWEKPGVAVVLRGLKGAGKDTLHNVMGRLVPHHHVVISAMRDLLSNFNGEQERALLLVLEEALWSRDRSGGHGKLQTIITAPRLRIERKGIDSVMRDSFSRVFMSSNEDWVVPASVDERRYFILDVSPRHLDDAFYFSALYKHMDTEGMGALLHFLQSYDLSNFNVRNRPNTKALGQQKMVGMRDLDGFWRDALMSCGLPGSTVRHSDGQGGPQDWRKGEIRVVADHLYSGYLEWRKDHRRPNDADAMVKDIFWHRLWETQLPPKPIMLDKAGKPILIGRQKVRVGNDRLNANVIPDLETCRRHFETRIQAKVDWPDAAPTEDDMPDEHDNDDVAEALI